MENLDEFIRKNKNAFDQQPNENHWQRFERKLNHHRERKKKPKTKQLNTWLKIAAIFFISIFGSWFVYSYLQKSEDKQINKNEIAVAKVSKEIEELQNYYQTSINAKMKQLEDIKCTKAGINKAQVKADLKEIDQAHQQLREELLYNANDERVINAMINCYRKKTEVLDQIIKSLNDNC